MLAEEPGVDVFLTQKKSYKPYRQEKKLWLKSHNL
jgi:hypothetical protein